MMGPAIPALTSPTANVPHGHHNPTATYRLPFSSNTSGKMQQASAAKKEGTPAVPPTPAAAAAAAVKTEATLEEGDGEGDLGEEEATRLVLSGARAALPGGQKRKRAVDVVSVFFSHVIPNHNSGKLSAL